MSPIEPRDEAVFEAARQLPAAERGAYLDQTCAGNPDLRRRVEGLLGAFERAGGFMKQPAMPSPQEREAALFTLALAEPAAARPAFLEAWCQGDAALRQRLEARLAAHDAPEAVASKEAPTVETTVKLDLPETPAEAVGQTLGRYKLLEKIGEGGCGTVYVAEQEKPVRRRVALKVIKLGMDTREVIARFEAERQALAMMDHPHIAKVLDAGTTQAGRPYFVMELVRGIRITDYCDQAHLSTKERLDLFIKVCQAIQHAHQKGIIHRDIKPSNILVTLHDGVAVPKVIDFGIAKATEGRLTEATVYTQLHQFLGTPAYMSPEQAEMTGLDIDTRSDIYSLGVLLYQLLTSQTPFDGKELLASGLDAMRKTIREKEPMRPSTRLAELKGDELTTTAKRRSVASAKLLHQLQGDLDCIVMKALEKERTRRYDTANGFAMDLQRFLSNEPVVARPPSTAYRLQKFIGRNKGMVGAAVVVAAALVVGILGSTWQAVRATRAETAARRNFYIADMHLAQQAWEQNNIEQLRQLLEETAMYPGRGLEWYYWQRQLHLEMMTLRGHLYGVLAVAFSPNGQRIVTCSYDKTAKVWEAATGKELLTLKGHSAWVISLAFSPDGQRIVTGSADQTAKVWEAATGKELLTLKGHSAHIRSVAFSPNGHRIVTGSSDATAKVWDAATGTELLTLKGHDGTIRSVAFSPDGLRIVTGSRDNTAKVWEAATGKELFPLKGHTNAIFSVAFSPDGHRIATGSGDATVKVWEAGSGRELLTCKGHSAEIGSVAFSPDGQRIVSGSIDKTAKVWEAATGKELLTLKGHSSPVDSVAFSPNGHQVITGGYDATARIWEAASGREPLTFKGHSNSINSLAFSPDGQRMVTGSSDATAKVWEVASGKELLSLQGHSNGIQSVAFSPDGQRIVTASEDKTAKVWQAGSGKPLLTLKGHKAMIGAVAFSPDSHRIATASADQTVKIWETATGKELLTLKGHTACLAVAFSPDGKQIAVGTDGTATVWEAATGKQLLAHKCHEAVIASITFSPDGQRILTASWDGEAKVWEAASGRKCLTLGGHGGTIGSAAYSPDGQRIVTGAGSEDRTAKVWEAATGKQLLTLKVGGSPVSWVAFSPDGRQIASDGGDHTAKVWKAASEAQVASWRQEEQAASESRAAEEREQSAASERERALRAQDPGAVKQWLVLLPIACGDRNRTRALQEEQVVHESQIQARAGEVVKLGAEDLVWRTVKLEDYVLDFSQLIGMPPSWPPYPWTVTYAVSYIQTGADQHGLLLQIRADRAKIYLNGKLIYQHEHPSLHEDVLTGVELKAGLNVLVLKVLNETEGWQASVRFTDAAGQPLKGIRATLDPESKQ